MTTLTIYVTRDTTRPTSAGQHFAEVAESVEAEALYRTPWHRSAEEARADAEEWIAWNVGHPTVTPEEQTEWERVAAENEARAADENARMEALECEANAGYYEWLDSLEPDPAKWPESDDDCEHDWMGPTIHDEPGRVYFSRQCSRCHVSEEQTVWSEPDPD